MLDLHMHTTASDGTDTPEQLIDKCADMGLTLCAITDHDTIDSQQPAIKRAEERGIPYLTGVELSVIHTGELHILGYGVDINDKAFSDMMADLIASRVGRVHAILAELKKHNISIGFEDVKHFAGGNALGRPHVALALAEKGYALNVHDAFVKYLNEGGLCYVQRRKLTAAQAIELILKAGGTPVLAHPKFVKTDDIAAQVKELTKNGLKGIEAYYPAHSDAEVEKFLAIARENELIVTQGSDYHGTMRDYVTLGCEKRGGLLLDGSIAFLRKKYNI